MNIRRNIRIEVIFKNAPEKVTPEDLFKWLKETVENGDHEELLKFGIRNYPNCGKWHIDLI